MWQRVVKYVNTNISGAPAASFCGDGEYPTAAQNIKSVKGVILIRTQIPHGNVRNQSC